MMDHTKSDQFTDDELRALLRTVLTLIHGDPPGVEADQRIEAALRMRHPQKSDPALN